MTEAGRETYRVSTRASRVIELYNRPSIKRSGVNPGSSPIHNSNDHSPHLLGDCCFKDLGITYETFYESLYERTIDGTLFQHLWLVHSSLLELCNLRTYYLTSYSSIRRGNRKDGIPLRHHKKPLSSTATANMYGRSFADRWMWKVYRPLLPDRIPLRPSIRSGNKVVRTSQDYGSGTCLNNVEIAVAIIRLQLHCQ